MKLIYVAGKYSADTFSKVEMNIRKAESIAIQLWKLGWAVITPHKNTAHFETYEKLEDISSDIWMEGCIEILSRCDAIVMLDNWIESEGSKKEYNYAEKNNIPIFFEEDLPSPEKCKKRVCTHKECTCNK